MKKPGRQRVCRSRSGWSRVGRRLSVFLTNRFRTANAARAMAPRITAGGAGTGFGFGFGFGFGLGFGSVPGPGFCGFVPGLEDVEPFGLVGVVVFAEPGFVPVVPLPMNGKPPPPPPPKPPPPPPSPPSPPSGERPARPPRPPSPRPPPVGPAAESPNGPVMLDDPARFRRASCDCPATPAVFFRPVRRTNSCPASAGLSLNGASLPVSDCTYFWAVVTNSGDAASFG